MNNSFFGYFIPGVLGILLQVFAVKIPSLKQKFKVSNKVFSFKDYLSDDWPTLAASFVSVGILIVGLDEVIKVRPEIANYIKWLFVFVGFTGSSIIQLLLSVANKKIMQVIDVKTNIADGVEPPVNDTNKLGAKEIQKDAGVDPGK